MASSTSSSSGDDDDDIEEAGSGRGWDSLQSRDDILVAGEGSESDDSVGRTSAEGIVLDYARFSSENFDGSSRKRKTSGKPHREKSDGKDSGFGKKRRRNVREGNDDEIEDEEKDEAGAVRGNSRGFQGVSNGGGEEHDEDEANADLSLRIVAKAEQLQSRKAQAPYRNARDTGGVRIATIAAASRSVESKQSKAKAPENSENEREFGSARLGIAGQSKRRTESPEDGELQDDVDENVVLALEPIVDSGAMEATNGTEEGELLPDADADRLQAFQLGATPAADDSSSGKSKKKKKKKKRKNKEEVHGEFGLEKAKDVAEVLASGGEGRAVENVEPATEADGTAEQSLVMRRLLRGPRYFDPPEDQEISCLNCGNLGHKAASCPDGPRLKPCYVCGAFGHEGRACPQKNECYVCGKGGHIAKNCPDKGSLKSSGRDGNKNICLKCGRSGHEAPNCHYFYDEADLAQVQCYVCGEFGHLCCVNVVDASPAPASCYNCGETGHTGVGCARPRRNDRDASADKGPASVCFKCGEEGHFARGCSKRRPSWPWSQEKSRGRYVDEDRTQPYSASRLPRWMDLERREPFWSRVDMADRWRGGVSRLSFGSRSGDSPAAFSKDKDVDSYMGPIENFVSPQHGSYRKRLKRSWTSTKGR